MTTSRLPGDNKEAGMLTVREALTRGADQLSANPLLRETALADAALLLMTQLGIERATLRAHPERKMDREQLAAYQGLIERRLRFEPVQYITGVQEFFGLELAVTPAVLIPRPETELLVEAVLARAAGDGTAARIVDVGTGSGAIAIALAVGLPEARVTAVDVSGEALAVARGNAARHGVGVRFVESDLLEALGAGERFEVIASNPPYIADSEGPGLHPQVREYEPGLALFAGSEGMAVYERLIPEAWGRLEVGGWLALEIGFGQRQAIARLLQGWSEIEFLDDLQGIARVVVARRTV